MNNIKIIGTWPDAKTGFLLNQTNKQDFVENYKKYFETDETTIVLCFGFKSPIIHTEEIATYNILELRDMKKFFTENNIGTNIQGIYTPDADTYEMFLSIMDQKVRTCAKKNIPKNMELLCSKIETNDFMFEIDSKDNKRDKEMAAELLFIIKQMHTKIIEKATEYAQIYDNVFVLLPVVHSLLIQQTKRNNRYILKTGIPKEEMLEVLFDQLLSLQIVPIMIDKD